MMKLGKCRNSKISNKLEVEVVYDGKVVVINYNIYFSIN
jgi:hypothetical protein